jgi:hypothetical protein
MLGDQYGLRVRVDRYPGYVLYPRLTHALSCTTSTFKGEVIVQVALAVLPSEDDWIEVDRLEFTEENSTIVKIIKGKFTWIRLLHDEAAGKLDSAVVS